MASQTYLSEFILLGSIDISIILLSYIFPRKSCGQFTSVIESRVREKDCITLLCYARNSTYEFELVKPLVRT